MKQNRKVCIASLDPSMEGGALTVMRTLYRFMETWEMDPYLLYTPVAKRAGKTVSKTHEYGMRCISAGSLLPNLSETLGDVFLFLRVRSYLNDASVFLCSGGGNHFALPFALSGKRFVCWISTVYSDEMAAQRKGRGRWRSRRDKIFYPIGLSIERMIYRKAALILAHSDYTARRIKELYPECGGKVAYLPVPVDVSLFRPNDTEVVSESACRVLFVGRINDPRKNARLLFKAFARVRAALPEAGLSVIGQKPRADLVELCDELGIRDAVRFLDVPYGENLAPHYNEADVFVLPSLQEGLGIVMLEALACGVPVVATRCGGAESVIRDGVNGYLVGNNDCDALSRAVISLLRDDALRKRMGQAGAEIVRQRFSLEAVGQRLRQYLAGVFPDAFAKEER